jgi:hypothetical protein
LGWLEPGVVALLIDLFLDDFENSLPSIHVRSYISGEISTKISTRVENKLRIGVGRERVALPFFVFNDLSTFS